MREKKIHRKYDPNKPHYTGDQGDNIVEVVNNMKNSLIYHPNNGNVCILGFPYSGSVKSHAVPQRLHLLQLQKMVSRR